MSGCDEPGLEGDTLVLAKKPLDALEGDRVDVPGVAREVGDLPHPAVVRRVEAVIHARGDAQRDVAPVTIVFAAFAFAQEFMQGVRKAFRLPDAGVLDAARCADD